MCATMLLVQTIAERTTINHHTIMKIQNIIASLLISLVAFSGLQAEDSRPNQRPDAPPMGDRGLGRMDPAVREEILAVRSQIAELEKQRIEEIRALGEEATRESVQAINEKYRAEIMALREDLREIVEANRPELPEDLKDEAEAIKAARDALKANREQLREDLAAATTAEEKKAVVDAFREANKELHETIRENRKAIRDGLKDAVTEETRPSDGE